VFVQAPSGGLRGVFNRGPQPLGPSCVELEDRFCGHVGFDRCSVLTPLLSFCKCGDCWTWNWSASSSAEFPGVTESTPGDQYAVKGAQDWAREDLGASGRVHHGMLNRKIAQLEIPSTQNPYRNDCNPLKLHLMRASFVYALLQVVRAAFAEGRRSVHAPGIYFPPSAFFASAARLISSAHRLREATTHTSQRRWALELTQGNVMRKRRRTCELLGAHNGSGVLLSLGLLRAGHLEKSVKLR
jgi:hypothetical protein